jgi:hypothetical protein
MIQAHITRLRHTEGFHTGDHPIVIFTDLYDRNLCDLTLKPISFGNSPDFSSKGASADSPGACIACKQGHSASECERRQHSVQGNPERERGL